MRMSAQWVDRIEAGVDLAASAIYAGATGVALTWLGASGTYVAVAGMTAFGWCVYGLRDVKPHRASFALDAFSPQSIEPVSPNRDRESGEAGADALILDDVLEAIGPDSRVVRLFDRDSMPVASPGETDRRSAPPDDSQALAEALAQLRRALR